MGKKILTAAGGYLRKSPSFDAKRIVITHFGDMVFLIGISHENEEWFHVETRGYILGWIKVGNNRNISTHQIAKFKLEGDMFQKWHIAIQLLFIGIMASSVDAELLFYEPFEDETSLSQNSGTVTGTSIFASGVEGQAINLPEASRVMFPIVNNFNPNEGTIQYWVWSQNDNHLGYWDIGLMGNPNSWGIFKNANYIVMEVKSSSNSYAQAWSPSPVYYDGKWHFISCPFKRIGNTTYFKICVDGKCKDSYDGMIENSNPSEAGSFYIGWNYWYGYSNSSFDEFKIFGHAKSNDEIFNDYQKYVENLPKECVRFKPNSTGRVKINCAGLFVDGKPFKVKGVGYQPIPIGKTAELLDHKLEVYENILIRERDFPLLRKMNANTIRTWSEVLSKSWLDDLYNMGRQPIYVLMGFWINCNENYGDQTVRQNYKKKFRSYVNEYKDHPAVLAWLLGNENNLGYCSAPDYIDDFYSLCNELAQIAYEIEGEEYHPVGIVNGDLWNIGVDTMNSSDDYLAYVDFWGTNVYPGNTFGQWFDEYKVLSGKPLLITEFGIDALNNSDMTEYEQRHAEWVLRQWKEIDQTDIAIGSTLMAYSDEWWKAGNWATHDYGGYDTDRHPDSYSNEEWWGVMRTVPKSVGKIDNMQPRKVYYTLQKAWEKTSMQPISSIFLLLNE